MADIKEANIVLIKERKSEVIKLLSLLNGFNEKELEALLMFIQGIKFSKQLENQSKK